MIKYQEDDTYSVVLRDRDKKRIPDILAESLVQLELSGLHIL